MRQLTNLELIRKAEDSVERLKLEKAVSLYDEGVRRFPNDTLIMDQYTDLLIQLGQFEKAKQLIERSIQLNPERDGQKYMNLAEMLSGADAV
jgi:tetratricopeptide (TPR) repeat protein